MSTDTDIRTGQHDERRIYRCKCGEMAQRTATVLWTRRTTWYLGHIHTDTDRRYRLTSDGPTMRDLPGVKCTCGRSMRSEVVSGRLNESVRCGSACRFAKGADCECSCAGANHGSAHRSL